MQSRKQNIAQNVNHVFSQAKFAVAWNNRIIGLFLIGYITTKQDTKDGTGVGEGEDLRNVTVTAHTGAENFLTTP
jgi:hypothetical protein